MHINAIIFTFCIAKFHAVGIIVRLGTFSQAENWSRVATPTGSFLCRNRAAFGFGPLVTSGFSKVGKRHGCTGLVSHER